MWRQKGMPLQRRSALCIGWGLQFLQRHKAKFLKDCCQLLEYRGACVSLCLFATAPLCSPPPQPPPRWQSSRTATPSTSASNFPTYHTSPSHGCRWGHLKPPPQQVPALLTVPLLTPFSPPSPRSQTGARPRTRPPQGVAHKSERIQTRSLPPSPVRRPSFAAPLPDPAATASPGRRGEKGRRGRGRRCPPAMPGLPQKGAAVGRAEKEARSRARYGSPSCRRRPGARRAPALSPTSSL